MDRAYVVDYRAMLDEEFEVSAPHFVFYVFKKLT